MNRKQRRAFAKAHKLTKEQMSALLAVQELRTTQEALKFENGYKVKLNVTSLKADADYERKVPEYRQFIDDNADTVFTVQTEEKYKATTLVSFVEAPRWLWWIGDLIKIEEDIDG